MYVCSVNNCQVQQIQAVEAVGCFIIWCRLPGKKKTLYLSLLNNHHITVKKKKLLHLSKPKNLI